MDRYSMCYIAKTTIKKKYLSMELKNVLDMALCRKRDCAKHSQSHQIKHQSIIYTDRKLCFASDRIVKLFWTSFVVPEDKHWFLLPTPEEIAEKGAADLSKESEDRWSTRCYETTHGFGHIKKSTCDMQGCFGRYIYAN